MPFSSLENTKLCLTHGKCEYLPSILELRSVNTRIIRDNIARGTVRDGRDKISYNPEGEYDAFGVKWVFDKATNGAVEKHGDAYLLRNVCDWKEIIAFPDPDLWDWDSEAKLSRQWLEDTTIMYKSTIFTGYFERLVSFMGFEEASIALIDEDSKEDLIALLERLTDYYISLVRHMKESFSIGLLEIHDDWGSQSSPFFSEETLRSTIIPPLKRLVDYAHSLGLYVEQHSCGKIETFIPCMIDVGIDMWMGQELNDKAKMIKLYGDKIVIEDEYPNLDPNATPEQIEKAARSFVDEHIFAGKTPMMSVYAYSYDNPPKLEKRIKQLAAEKLASF